MEQRPIREGRAAGYILREYGSWGVLTLAFLTGLAVAGKATWGHLAVYLGVALAMNSKQAFALWARGRRLDSLRHAAAFLLQLSASAILLFAVFGTGILKLLPLGLLPVAYLLSFRVLGEHSLITESVGFGLLSLSAVLAGFVAEGSIDYRLFAAVALFFIAGVFKVRVQMRKGIRERCALLGYCAAAGILYLSAAIPLLPLVPLIDNVIFSLKPYRVKLRTTGWVEMAKGFLFLALMAFAYK